MQSASISVWVCLSVLPDRHIDKYSIVRLRELSVLCTWCVYVNVVSVDTGHAIYVRFFSDVESRTAFVAHFAGFLGGESSFLVNQFIFFSSHSTVFPRY